MSSYIPIPYRKPNKVLSKYTELFIDVCGNEADITYVDYTDKKGVLHKKYTMFVKWRNA